MRMRLMIVTMTVALLAGLGVTSIEATAQEPADPAEPSLTSETFRVGPFDLAAQGQPGDQVNRLGVEVPRPEGDVAVTDITYRFVDENGADIPPSEAHLHHLVLVDEARPDQLCDDTPASRFGGTGMELTEMHLPAPYAYVSPAGRWGGVYHVMNISDQPVTASIEYTVTYGDPSVDDFLDVEPYFFDVTGCWSNSASEYQVPGGGGPGSVHEKSKTYAMTRDGTIVAGIGHVHAGGIDITLHGPGGEYCRSEAVYSYDGHHDQHHGLLTAVTPCGEMGQQVAAGDELTLTSRYMNEHPTDGAMGILNTYIHHTGPPPPSPSAEVRVDGVDGSDVLVTVTCNRPLEGYVELHLSQDRRGPVIAVSGHTDGTFTCSDEPSEHRVTLRWGNGVLARGETEYELYGWFGDAGEYVNVDDAGLIDLPRRIDIGYQMPDEIGSLPITVDRRSTRTAQGQAVTGTIACTEPAEMDVAVEGMQRVGRHYVFFFGYTTVQCDGVTDYSVEIVGGDAQVTHGTADISVRAFNYVTLDDTTVHNDSVRLRNPRTPTADPTSAVQIDAVRRVGDTVFVDVRFAGCPRGSHWSPSVRLAKRHSRANVPNTYSYGYASAPCTGDDEVVTVEVPVTGRLDKVSVWVSADYLDGDEYVVAVNGGSHRLR